MTLVDRVVEAHGGLDAWQSAKAVTLALSSGGLAFTSKGHPTTLHGLEPSVATDGQRVELRGQGWTESFEEIPEPRGWRWTTTDIAAFAAAALWTYVSLPFVLPELDVDERGDRLVVRFPPGLRTHSPTQVLHVDERGLIRRHDYTALAFGRWARARQDVDDYVEVGGILVARRRRVRPRLWPHRPLLVWIDVHEANVVRRDARS